LVLVLDAAAGRWASSTTERVGKTGEQLFGKKGERLKGIQGDQRLSVLIRGADGKKKKRA